MIEGYDFGWMIISGKKYTKDLIIYDDKVVMEEWWRREGHSLHVEDVKGVVERLRPKTLVVGTGYNGLMEVPHETEEYLKSMGALILAEKTGDAYRTYNEKLKSKSVMGAFHLTC